MSRFITTLKAPVEQVLATLPAGADVEDIRALRDVAARTVEVQIVWSHEKLAAPMIEGTEVTLEQLRNGTLPKGVRDLRTGKAVSRLETGAPAERGAVSRLETGAPAEKSAQSRLETGAPAEGDAHTILPKKRR